MSLTLKLDASAVRAIFPEGTECRAELSRAVVAEIVKKLPSSSSVQNDVEKYLANRIASDAVENVVISNDRWSNKKDLTQLAKDIARNAIEAEVKQKASSIISSMARDAVNEHMPAMTSRISELLESRLNSESEAFKEQVSQIIRNKMSAVVDEILKKGL